MSFFRRHYGASPLHLLALLACFALSGYIVDTTYHAGHGQRILVWFVVAIVGHDVVLFPLYALADRSLHFLDARRHPGRLPDVPWINYVRVPVVICAMLLAVSWPLVLDRSERTYHAATGLTLAPYEGRYLLIVAVAFGASAILYAARLGRAGAARRRLASLAGGGAPVAPLAPGGGGTAGGALNGHGALAGGGAPVAPLAPGGGGAAGGERRGGDT